MFGRITIEGSAMPVHLRNLTRARAASIVLHRKLTQMEDYAQINK